MYVVKYNSKKQLIVYQQLDDGTEKLKKSYARMIDFANFMDDAYRKGHHVNITGLNVHDKKTLEEIMGDRGRGLR